MGFGEGRCFFVGIDPLQGVTLGFPGFYFNYFRSRALTERSQHACSYACLIEEWQD